MGFFQFSSDSAEFSDPASSPLLKLMQLLAPEQGGYSEQRRRQRLGQSKHEDTWQSPLSPRKAAPLLTDRNAYLGFLENQLERVSAACLQVEGIRRRQTQIGSEHESLLERVDDSFDRHRRHEEYLARIEKRLEAIEKAQKLSSMHEKSTVLPIPRYDFEQVRKEAQKEAQRMTQHILEQKQEEEAQVVERVVRRAECRVAEQLSAAVDDMAQAQKHTLCVVERHLKKARNSENGEKLVAAVAADVLKKVQEQQSEVKLQMRALTRRLQRQMNQCLQLCQHFQDIDAAPPFVSSASLMSPTASQSDEIGASTSEEHSDETEHHDRFSGLSDESDGPEFFELRGRMHIDRAPSRSASSKAKTQESKHRKTKRVLKRSYKRTKKSSKPSRRRRRSLYSL